MTWSSRPLVLAAFGTLLTAISAMATTLATESATKPPPFNSSGSVLGFMPAPALEWNLFLGGSGYDSTLGKIPGVGIAVDANGNLYVTGVSESTWGDPIRPWAGSGDAFVAKLDANGALLWNTFLGGSATDSGSGIAVDASGNVYVTGKSAGTWGDPPPVAGTGGVFVVKLDTNGALLWNSFLGGEYGFGIAVDASGNVVVTGNSYGTWGNPIRPYSGYRDAFVAKLDTEGALLWNSFLGGTTYDEGKGIAVDSNGNVFVAGHSYGSWGDPIGPWAESWDGFVAKLDTDGNLTWNTFFGGTGFDWSWGIATDASNNVAITGRSDGTWGDPIRPWPGGTHEAFVAKFDTNGALLWNTFLGGTVESWGRGIAVDSGGTVSVTGESYGTWGDPRRPWAGSYDAFAAKLDVNGALLWNSFLGGANFDGGYGIALDWSGNVSVAGLSCSAWGDPISPWVRSYDAFVARLTKNPPIAYDQAPITRKNIAKMITLSATDADGDALTFTVVTSPAHGTLSGTAPNLTYQPAADFVGADAFTFKATDGSFDSSIATVLITVSADTTPPTGSFFINDGDEYTKSSAVTLTISAGDLGGSGLDSMRFANSGNPASAWEPFQATKTWTVSGDAGTKTVWVQIRDRAGNISDADRDKPGAQAYRNQIVFDPVAPTGSILINNGASSTSTRSVTLKLPATDTGGSGLEAMRFVNSGGTVTAWEPFLGTKAWTLTSGAGTKTVWVQFRDRAGNISDADPVKAGAQSYKDAIRYTGR